MSEKPWIRNHENHFSSRLYSNEANDSSGLHFSVHQWACWMRTRSFPLVLLSSSQILWLQEALPCSPCPGMGLTSPERLEAWTDCGKLPCLLLGRSSCDWGLPCWPSGEEHACQCRRRMILGSGRFPGEGNGNHSSILDWEMDRGAWWATVHGIMKELDTT